MLPLRSLVLSFFLFSLSIFPIAFSSSPDAIHSASASDIYSVFAPFSLFAESFTPLISSLSPALDSLWLSPISSSFLSSSSEPFLISLVAQHETTTVYHTLTFSSPSRIRVSSPETDSADCRLALSATIEALNARLSVVSSDSDSPISIPSVACHLAFRSVSSDSFEFSHRSSISSSFHSVSDSILFPLSDSAECSVELKQSAKQQNTEYITFDVAANDCASRSFNVWISAPVLSASSSLVIPFPSFNRSSLSSAALQPLFDDSFEPIGFLSRVYNYPHQTVEVQIPLRSLPSITQYRFSIVRISNNLLSSSSLHSVQAVADSFYSHVLSASQPPSVKGREIELSAAATNECGLSGQSIHAHKEEFTCDNQPVQRDEYERRLSEGDCSRSLVNVSVCYCPFEYTGPRCEVPRPIRCDHTFIHPNKSASAISPHELISEFSYDLRLNGDQPRFMFPDSVDPLTGAPGTEFSVSTRCQFLNPGQATEGVDPEVLKSLTAQGFNVTAEQPQFEYDLLIPSPRGSGVLFSVRHFLPIWLQLRAVNFIRLSDTSQTYFVPLSAESFLDPASNPSHFFVPSSSLSRDYRRGGRIMVETQFFLPAAPIGLDDRYTVQRVILEDAEFNPNEHAFNSVAAALSIGAFMLWLALFSGLFCGVSVCIGQIVNDESSVRETLHRWKDAILRAANGREPSAVLLRDQED